MSGASTVSHAHQGVDSAASLGSVTGSAGKSAAVHPTAVHHAVAAHSAARG